MEREIVRKPDRAEGGITKEETALLKIHTAKWIANAMRTDKADPEIVKKNIIDLYAAAGLPAPRVVLVPSPLVMAIAYGFSAAIWHFRDTTPADLDMLGIACCAVNSRTRAIASAVHDAVGFGVDIAVNNSLADNAYNPATAPYASTRIATQSALDEAVAVNVATAKNVFLATSPTTANLTSGLRSKARVETSQAMGLLSAYWAVCRSMGEAVDQETANSADFVFGNVTDATYDAMYNFIDVSANWATHTISRDWAAHIPGGWASSLAEKIAGGNNPLAKLMISCVSQWYKVYQGGNMWSGYDCYLTGARDVLGLRLPAYEQYKAWEACATSGGFRVMHEKFCLVSDFPEVLTKDDQHRPHNDSGPSHKWRDGWSLWYIHGIKVTQQIVEAPETLTIEQIENEQNAEVRRVMIERFGMERFLKESHAEKIHEDDYGILYRKKIVDDEPLVMVKVVNSTPEPDGTYKDYFLRVPPNIQRAREAVAWTFDIPESDYVLSAQT